MRKAATPPIADENTQYSSELPVGGVFVRQKYVMGREKKALAIHSPATPASLLALRTSQSKSDYVYGAFDLMVQVLMAGAFGKDVPDNPWFKWHE